MVLIWGPSSCPFSLFCFPCSIPCVIVRTTIALASAVSNATAGFSVLHFPSSVLRFQMSASDFTEVSQGTGVGAYFDLPHLRAMF